MKETIIQFGEGNFLRGFVDDFIHKLRQQGLYDGSVVIVQPIAKGLSALINAQKGKYNLFLRGLKDGAAVSERVEVSSVSRAVNPYVDFEAYIALAKNPDMRFIVSNTTEAGIAYDNSCRLTDRPAGSFPGKLTQLLFARFRSGLPGFVILACELIDNNGAKLLECVLQYARQWELGADFQKWLEKENTFCNTLVDRIVTGYPKDEAVELCTQIGSEDRLLDTAEPFHLWVIEGGFEKELPLQQAGVNVIWTKDAAPYKKRKVRVLNGAHTSLVFPAMLCGLQTVGECLEDEQLTLYLKSCLFGCILPALGETAENMAFAADVLERFANPYIRHQLKSISLNSVSKFSVRVLPTILDFYNQNGCYPKPLLLSLAALIEYYKTGEPLDEAESISYIKTNKISHILANADLWGMDLSDMTELVEEGMKLIQQCGMREAIQWSLH